MTTLVYHKGELAADSQATLGAVKAHTNKIVCHAGRWFAFAGKLAQGEAFMRALASGSMPPSIDECYVLEMQDDASLHVWESATECVHMQPGASLAWGSGNSAAMAALHCGVKSAAAAVRIAAKVDIYTGGPVSVLRVKDKQFVCTRMPH